MYQPESNFPLLVGLVLAVGLHLAAAAGYGVYQREITLDPEPAAPPRQPAPEPKLPEPEPAPKPDPKAVRPDLAAVSLDVAEPRYPNRPVTLRARLANLGAAVTEPFDVDITLDGQPLTTAAVTDSLAPGDVVELTRPILIEQPGEHVLGMHVDRRERIDDSNRANNRLTRRFTWAAEPDEIVLGQDEPSEVDINWITYDDFQDLLARRERFDQAVVQAAVTPDPEATQAPIDPTPPMPKPSPDRPAPVAAAEPAPQPVTPRRLEEPMPRPDQPKRPNPTEQPERLAAGLDPRPDVPRRPDTTPMTEKPADPTAIAARRPEAEKPQPITDDTPAKEPVTAPPAEARPDREVAMATLPTPDTVPGSDPVVPTPDEDHPAKDKVQAEAPPMKPADEPVPDDRSTKIESPKLPAPAPPTPRGKPDAPPAESPPADKPSEKAERMVDGAEPQPPAEQIPQAPQTEAPSQPVPSDKPRPTAAPKDQREAPPVSRIEALQVQPGKVVARHGLEIRTVIPRFSVVAMSSSVPTNPIVELTFDETGKVIQARFVRSTGYDNLDGPILASLYKWTAGGKALANIEDQFIIQITILMVPEP